MRRSSCAPTTDRNSSAARSGTNESFNGRFRDECLSVEWFRSRAEAAVVIEIWRRHYNAVRPHSSIHYVTPLEFKQQHHPVPNRAVLQEMIGPNNQGQVTLPRCHRRSVSPQPRASNPRFSSISMTFGSVKYLVKVVTVLVFG